jgi:hypothetical protein
MANKEQVIEIFNAQFKELLDDVLRLFPTLPDLVAAKKAVTKVIAITPSTLIKLFRTHVTSQYGDKIAAGDLAYFLEHDYASDLTNMGLADESNLLLQKIDALREPIRQMAPQEQQHVLKYMQNLCQLSLLVLQL